MNFGYENKKFSLTRDELSKRDGLKNDKHCELSVLQTLLDRIRSVLPAVLQDLRLNGSDAFGVSQSAFFISLKNCGLHLSASENQLLWLTVLSHCGLDKSSQHAISSCVVKPQDIISCFGGRPSFTSVTRDVSAAQPLRQFVGHNQVSNLIPVEISNNWNLSMHNEPNRFQMSNKMEADNSKSNAIPKSVNSIFRMDELTIKADRMIHSSTVQANNHRDISPSSHVHEQSQTRNLSFPNRRHFPNQLASSFAAVDGSLVHFPPNDGMERSYPSTSPKRQNRSSLADHLWERRHNEMEGSRSNQRDNISHLLHQADNGGADRMETNSNTNKQHPFVGDGVHIRGIRSPFLHQTFVGLNPTTLNGQQINSLEENYDFTDIISKLQKLRIQIALIFRKYLGVTRNMGQVDDTSQSVKCIEFSEALRQPPFSFNISHDIAWELSCKIAGFSRQVDPQIARIMLVDVIKFLDNEYENSINDQQGKRINQKGNHVTFGFSDQQYNQASTMNTTIPTFKAIQLQTILKNKLKNSKDIQNNKQRLLSLTSQLRVRLKNRLSRGGIGLSWEASLEECSVSELIQLLSTIDLHLTVEEGMYIAKVTSMDSNNTSIKPSPISHTNYSLESGVSISKVLRFLADLIE